MFPFIVLLLSTITFVQADLTCLEWGVVSSTAGMFCHFKHSSYNAVEDVTVQAVINATIEVKDLVRFDVTQHSVILAYNYVETAGTSGEGEAVNQMQGAGQEYVNATLSFGKETANMIVSVLDLSYWNDLSFCLISNAVIAADSLNNVVASAVTDSGTVGMQQKRANTLSQALSQGILTKCLNQRFKRISNAAVFNITGE